MRMRGDITWHCCHFWVFAFQLGLLGGGGLEVPEHNRLLSYSNQLLLAWHCLATSGFLHPPSATHRHKAGIMCLFLICLSTRCINQPLVTVCAWINSRSCAGSVTSWGANGTSCDRPQCDGALGALQTHNTHPSLPSHSRNTEERADSKAGSYRKLTPNRSY